MLTARHCFSLSGLRNQFQNTLKAQILGVYNSMDDADKKANSVISLGDGDEVIESREDDSVF